MIQAQRIRGLVHVAPDGVCTYVTATPKVIPRGAVVCSTTLDKLMAAQAERYALFEDVSRLQQENRRLRWASWLSLIGLATAWVFAILATRGCP